MGSNEVHYAQDGTLYIRKSMVENYNFCPLQFKKIWVDGREKTPDHRMLMGTRFHEFAYLFFDYCEAISIDHWVELIPEEFNDEEVRWAQWFIELEKNRYYKFALENRVADWRPLMKELRMVDNKIYLESTVDRVDWFDRTKDEVTLIEYKTGDSINDVSVMRQLAFYMILWNSVIGLGKVVELKVINPRIQQIRKYSPDDGLVATILQDISNLRVAMKKGIYFPKCSENKIAICKMCSPAEVGVWKDSDRVESFDLDVARHRFSEVYE